MRAQSHKSYNVQKALRSHTILTIVCIICSTGLLMGSFVAPENLFYTSCRTVANVVVLPLRMLGNILQTSFLQVRQDAEDNAQTQESYTVLREENEKLKTENIELKEKVTLLDQLQSLLNFRDTSGVSTVAASVIGRDIDSLSSSITINQGSNAGVEVGMAVTDDSGVVGQVMSVQPFSANVRLISDERSSISAYDQQSRAIGQIEGTGSDTIRMTHVPLNQTVSVGDIILTSGLGGAFPKGLVIGTVTSVDRAQGSQFYIISVKLAANLTLAENVLVVTLDSNTKTTDDL